jgi:hypothetical protein
MITTDKILKEYFYRRDDGGAFFNVNNYDDLHQFESFLIESGYINQIDRNKLNELFGSTTIGKTGSFLQSIWDRITNVVKSGYRQIVSKFKARLGVVEQTIGSHDLEDVFYVTIPTIDEPNIGEFQKLTQDLSNSTGEEKPVTEGAEEATKGYYNEALTCEFIIRKNKTPVKVKIISESIMNEVERDDEMVVVQLENERSSEIQKIRTRVLKNEQDLKTKTGKKFDELKRLITIASQDMADHLINSVGISGGVITEILLVGGEEIYKGVEHKADIKLKIRKGGKESINAYSLKMYSNKNVVLANLGIQSVIEKLIDDAAEIEKFNRTLKADTRYQFSAKMYLSIKNIKYRYQKTKDKESLIKELLALPFSSEPQYNKIRNDVVGRIKVEQDIETITDILRKMRAAVGYESNQLGMDRLSSTLNSYIKKSDDNLEKFAWNLLKVIGFTDKDTDILLSVAGPRQIKAGKTEIIDKHPELNLKSIVIKHSPGTAYMTVVNKENGKPIVKFNIKEGGKKLTSMVSFSAI